MRFLQHSPTLVFDLETTGLDPRVDKICQIGWVFFPAGLVGGEPAVIGGGYVDPAQDSTQSAFETHGLTAGFLARHAYFHTENGLCRVAREFHEHLLKADHLVAHRALFDWEFITKAYEAAGHPLPFPETLTDTKAESRRIFPMAHKDDSSLTSMVRFFQMRDRGEKHDAVIDAVLTAGLAHCLSLMDYPPSEGFTTKLDELRDMVEDGHWPYPFLANLLPYLVPKLEKGTSGGKKMDAELGRARKIAESEIGTTVEARETTHGSFEDNSLLLDGIMTLIDDHAVAWDDLSPRERVALYHIVSKVSRYVSEPDVDSLRDIMGYAYLAKKAATDRGVQDSGRKS